MDIFAGVIVTEQSADYSLASRKMEGISGYHYAEVRVLEESMVFMPERYG